MVRGVPNPAVGIAYYSALIGVAAAFELSPDSYWLLLAAAGLAGAGLLASAWLAYLGLAVLRAVCPVCVGLWVINAALAALAAYVTHMQRAFLEYDSAFLAAMAAAPKQTHGDYNPHQQHDLWTS
uniref:Vitamin K epoxide reductase domain-containing protein n=1 Tax=Cryptomonas curvata TaxID=233186 RepID=A0A7S0M1X5_9CRYP